MPGRLSRLSALLGSWFLYWLLLIGVKLGPAIAAIFRATRQTGSGVNVSFGDRGFELAVTQAGQSVYHATVGFLAFACWIGIPPLILWVAWAINRRRDTAPASMTSAG